MRITSERGTKDITLDWKNEQIEIDWIQIQQQTINFESDSSTLTKRIHAHDMEIIQNQK